MPVEGPKVVPETVDDIDYSADARIDDKPPQACVSFTENGTPVHLHADLIFMPASLDHASSVVDAVVVNANFLRELDVALSNVGDQLDKLNFTYLRRVKESFSELRDFACQNIFGD